MARVRYILHLCTLTLPIDKLISPLWNRGVIIAFSLSKKVHTEDTWRNLEQHIGIWKKVGQWKSLFLGRNLTQQMLTLPNKPSTGQNSCFGFWVFSACRSVFYVPKLCSIYSHNSELICSGQSFPLFSYYNELCYSDVGSGNILILFFEFFHYSESTIFP